MNRVVVTGMGTVSPLGVGVNNVWKKLIESESGISAIDSFYLPDTSSKIAGMVPKGDYSQGKWNDEEWVEKKELKRMAIFIAYAISAAQQAITDSGLSEMISEMSDEFGVHIGSGIGGLQNIYEASFSLSQGNHRKISPFFIPSALINLASGHVAIKHGLRGPNLSLVTACATGTHSLIDSYKIIRDGDAKAMVVGASESTINPIGITGFDRMNALSKKYNDNPEIASRPWDIGRDGFVMAEGAGVLILESYDHAKSRGAKIYAEVIGYGCSGDGNHITSPDEQGRGAAICMKKAMEKANLKKEDIGYINAHGTSTPLGDVAEIRAIKNVFEKHAYNLAISSTKGSTGHLLGAAGAVEAIFCIKALETGIIPPTLNLDNAEPECDLNLVPKVFQKRDIQYAMSNSFGFGGTNGTIILKKHENN